MKRRKRSKSVKHVASGSKKAPTVRKMKEKLDIAWSKNVRSKGVCERCGSTVRLNAHHIFTRSYAATRWAVSNGVCLCWRCHFYFAHHLYEEFRDWIIKRIGEKEYDQLKRQALGLKKWTVGEMVEHYKALTD
jgi:5-methylcytosine-specific restriction endonuclease McrA